MKKFCLSCNFGTEYTSMPPKFCSNCGKPYIDTANAHISPISTRKSPIAEITINNRQIIDAEYPEDATSVPNIGKIECQLTTPNLRPSRQTANQLFTEGYNGIGIKTEKIEVVKKKTTKSDKERMKNEAIQNFKNEMTLNGRKSQREYTDIGE